MSLHHFQLLDQVIDLEALLLVRELSLGETRNRLDLLFFVREEGRHEVVEHEVAGHSWLLEAVLELALDFEELLLTLLPSQKKAIYFFDLREQLIRGVLRFLVVIVASLVLYLVFQSLHLSILEFF